MKTRKILFIAIAFFTLFIIKSATAKSASAFTTILSATADNTAGTIPINVTFFYRDGNGANVYQNTITVPAGSSIPMSYSYSSTPVEPYQLQWGTDCFDPPVDPIYTITPGGGYAVYGFGNQDVHCATTNSEPSITNTSCATVGWTLIGVGTNGANVDHFLVFESTSPSPTLDSASPVSVPGNQRSYTFSGLGSGTYYVRVSAVSPQGQFSAPSYGQFTCSGTVITAASGLSANPFCPSSGSGSIVAVNYSWAPSSPAGNPQYLDYSIWPNNFAPGTYNNYLVTGASSYSATLYPQGVTFYWRVNNQINGNWYPSVTGSFTTPSCPVTTTPAPTVAPTATPTPGTCPAGCTVNTVTLSVPSRAPFQDRLCLAGTSICQPYRSTGGSNSDTWTVPSNVNFDLNVLISDGLNWYGWENQTNVCNTSGTSCTVTWAGTDYQIKTTIDGSVSHNVPYSGLSYTYTSYPFNFSFTGEADFKDFDNFGTSHKWASYSGTTPSNPCNCPSTPAPTATPVPAVITLSGYSDCTDGINPRIHLTWTSNTGATGYTVNRDSVNVTSQGLPNPLGSFDRSWNSTAAQPAGAHNWYVVGTGGSFSGTTSTTVSITTATCSPPPADPSNLQVTSACDASGNPVLTFRWLNNASNETGFWMDVSHDAFTGPSSTTASPSVWGVKGITSTAPSGTTIQFIWNNVSPTTNTQGILDSGDVDSAVAGNQLAPERGVVYYWRVKAYSADRQSNHVYPTSTTVPPGISFTTPTCMFDLAVENGPAGNTQVYDPGATANLTVRVYNTPQAQVNFTGGSGAIGFWPTTATLPNCSGSPQVPQTPSASQTISSTLVPGADTHLGSFQDFTFTFTVGTTPGTYVANFYALPSCTPNNDLNWGNNLFQLTYAVSAKAWFQTAGGDVGASGNIQVSNPTPPAAQSSYVLAGNPLDASVVGKWELNNYAHPLFPTNNTRVYDYLNSRFRSKANDSLCTINFVNLASRAGNKYIYCTSDTDAGGDLSTIAGNNNWVIFVDGNLTVSANLKLSATSTAVFIVRGNITVNTTVTQADGVYIAGGTFADYDNTGTKSRNTPPYQLLINGAVYAHAFDLSAFLSNQPGCTPTASACDNHLVPTDMVVFQPRYLITISQLIGSPSVSWQEVAP